ncbi:transglycosylase SLT domain-containing protein [Actinocrispum sp. NPDC049592]|uniref:transglycosylase SLT domain-containing protein n=1 Tax=Actinocrispum sp. NPDC049592 TaxID=3154835 RepID=UPI00341856DB
MSKLSAEQIAQYARHAGFKDDGLTVAVAVALAESGGDPKAHNATPPDNSYGLWQINMLGALGPERRGQYHLRSNDELFDPAVNARVANSISQDGKSWTPWSTYTNGTYTKYLSQARQAVRSTRPHTHKPGSHVGYQVDPGLLHGFVRRTKRVADELGTATTKHLQHIRDVTDGSFGKIGEESGFAAALDHFGAALSRQVREVATNADALATSTAKAATAYRDQENDAAARFGQRNP